MEYTRDDILSGNYTLDGLKNNDCEVGMIYNDPDGFWEILWISWDRAVIQNIETNQVCVVPEIEAKYFCLYGDGEGPRPYSDDWDLPEDFDKIKADLSCNLTYTHLKLIEDGGNIWCKPIEIGNTIYTLNDGKLVSVYRDGQDLKVTQELAEEFLEKYEDDDCECETLDCRDCPYFYDKCEAMQDDCLKNELDHVKFFWE